MNTPVAQPQKYTSCKNTNHWSDLLIWGHCNRCSSKAVSCKDCNDTGLVDNIINDSDSHEDIVDGEKKCHCVKRITAHQ